MIRRRESRIVRPLRYFKGEGIKQQQKEFRKIWRQLHVGQQGVCVGFADAKPKRCGHMYSVVEDGMKLFPLTWICVKEPSVELVRCLYQAFPQAVSDKVNDGGVLPLHYACRYGASLEVVKFLVKQYPEGAKQADKNGNLPLHYACGKQLEWYCGGEEQHGDEEGGVPAKRRPNMEILQYLISAYPDSVKAQNNDWMLPLHSLCSFRPDFETTHYLLSEYPEAAATTNRMGRLPGQFVAGEEDVIALLAYVAKNLQDPRKSFALPMSRFAVEWEIMHQQHVLKCAQTANLEEGEEAKQLLELVLYELRQYYPSKEELKRMAWDGDVGLRQEWSMSKEEAESQLDYEVEDAERIPRESLERHESRETSSNVDVTDIQHVAEKIVLVKCGLSTAATVRAGDDSVTSHSDDFSNYSTISSLEDDSWVEPAPVDSAKVATIPLFVEFSRPAPEEPEPPSPQISSPPTPRLQIPRSPKPTESLKKPLAGSTKKGKRSHTKFVFGQHDCPGRFSHYLR